MAGVRAYQSKIMDTVIEAAAGFVIDLKDMGGMDIEVDAVVNSTAKTAVDNTQASLAIGTTVTYTATAAYAGAAGNAITIAFVAGGTAGAEIVTVVGTAISVSMDTTLVTGSTGTQIKAAIAASVAATALVSSSGTDAAVQAAQSATPLAGGVTSKFSLTADTITISAHGFYTGLKLRLTSTGTLPTGLATGTDYYVIVIDANTIQLSAALAGALAATVVPIDITAYGSTGETATFTPVAVSACSYKLQKSNSWDPITSTGNFIDLVAGETNSVVTNAITVTANTAASAKQLYAAYGKILFAISAGSVSIKVYASAKAL
jgi:hypothetical protein